MASKPSLWSNPYNLGGAAVAGLGVVVATVLGVSRCSGGPCQESIVRVTEAIDANAWAAAELALPEARIRCPDRRPEIRALEEKIAAHAAPLGSTTAAVASLDANKKAAEAKMDAAAKVWAAYEALPPAKRTKDTWKDALAESVGYGRDLGPPMDRIFRENNMARARQNMAPLINPDAKATGPMFNILVPSPDPTKCAVWGAMWIQETDAMTTSGFTKIHCDGARRKSSVTGEMIQEPDQDWIVP